MWEEIVEKIIDTKAKASLQPLSGIKKIHSRCPKSYRPSAKKEKDKASQEHQDEDKDKNKAKLYNLLSANTSQPQTQTSKKNKYHRNW